jgi:hypothetical protein
MMLSHFSDKPLSRASLVALEPDSTHWKPRGFWVSVDGPDDWEEWCASEGFRLERLAIRHRVTLTGAANILRLSFGMELDDFTRRYSGEWCGFRGNKIDWPKVAADYDGIIIAPYVSSCRLDGPSSDWYYSWDCASGCIWNLDVITSVEVIADLQSEAA